jgi:hypothetical protein
LAEGTLLGRCSASIFSTAASSAQTETNPATSTAAYTRRSMAKLTPADVTADAFEAVAQRAGTLELVDVKAALAGLREREKEKPKANSREKHVL